MFIDELKQKYNKQFIISTNDKVVIFQENKSSYRANNKSCKLIYKLTIDKGIFYNNNCEKCDNGIYVDVDKTLIIIELKGNDIVKAYKQIKSTCDSLDLKTYKNCGKNSIVLKVRVVCSNNHYKRYYNCDHDKKYVEKVYGVNDYIVKEKIVDEL